MPLNPERLREMRKARGLSQSDLAYAANISLKQVWRWENGQGDPTGEHLRLIAQELQVSADYLINLTIEPRHYLAQADLTKLEADLVAELRSDHPETALVALADAIAKYIKQKAGVPGSYPKLEG